MAQVHKPHKIYIKLKNNYKANTCNYHTGQGIKVDQPPTTLPHAPSLWQDDRDLVK